uniref:Uncharacterized protein n=1 Tax=Arundo donax TaxID=35708 RepID=A0A0A9F571_ARUDO
MIVAPYITIMSNSIHYVKPYKGLSICMAELMHSVLFWSLLPCNSLEFFSLLRAVIYYLGLLSTKSRDGRLEVILTMSSISNT